MPKSLVTIATIIRRGSSSYLAYRESDCVFCSLLASSSFAASSLSFRTHYPSQIGRMVTGWTRDRRARHYKSVWPLVDSCSLRWRQRAREHGAQRRRACATLAPRTTNRGLESRACHPSYLCHQH